MTEDQLKEKLRKFKVHRGDVVESFICSSGPGGQNVNKVATCVVLNHRPTGIIVKCQAQRSQYQNRLMAWEMLIKKIVAKERNKIAFEKTLKEKLRRANRQKPKSLKEQILRRKKIDSEKKRSRNKLSIHRINRDE